MNEMQKSILESISLVANSSVKNAGTTLTIEAKVLSVEDSGIGAYKIEYMGNKFQAYSNNQSIQYSVDDKVYVIIPDGDFTKTKVIIGAVAPKGNIYTASSDAISNYLEKSDNLLPNIPNIKLCTYKSENTEINLADLIGNFNALLTEYLTKYNTLSFSFKVKTNIPLEQRANGNYGLKLVLPFNIKKEDGSLEPQYKDYIIDVNNMIGNPYGFSVYTTQTFYFTIDDVAAYNKNELPRLYAFVENFRQSSEEKEFDIFIEDINLKIVDVLTEANKVGYFLSIKAEEGEFFASQYKESKKLTPVLMINGHNTEVKGYDCYWFVEDTSIDETSEYYLARAGRGWKCLNERINVTTDADGVETFQYKADNYEYIVEKNTVKTNLRYKCVIVYEDSPVSGVIEIKNLDSNIKLELITNLPNSSTTYVKDIGEVHLICRTYYDGITNSNTPAATISYDWVRYDKKGTFLNKDFFELVSLNKQKEINGEIYYETEIKFKTAIIEELNTISCTVKSEQVIDSVPTETIIGTETISIVTSENFDYLLSIQNGDVVYNYDADGDSPMIAGYDGPETSVLKEIKPLSYEMHKKDGTVLTEDEYASCETTWKIPKNSMIEIKNDEDINIIDEENNPYFIIQGKGKINVPYTIASQFNKSKSDNTVLLEVKFDNNVINVSASIKFLKDGESGTNGTKFSVLITHDGYAYGDYDEEKNPRKLQLVYVKGDGWKRYDIDSKSLLNFNDSPPKFDISVYKDGELVSSFDKNTVIWSIFDRTATDPCFDFEDSNILSIKENWENPEDVFCNIVQAQVRISKEQSVTNSEEYIYAYYPIEITYLKSADIANSIIPSLQGGFSSVLYASDGTHPRYDTTFNFQCYDNLYNNDTGDLYDYAWSASDNLRYEAIEDGKSCKVTPIEKYENGISKNYVKAVLSMSAAKKAEAEEIATNCQTEVTYWEGLIEHYQNNCTYLTNFISAFKYVDWLNQLKASRPMLAKRTESINTINKVLEILNEFNNFYLSKKNIIGNIDTLNSIYTTNIERAKLAKDRLFELGASGKNLTTLLDLSGHMINLTSEQIKTLKEKLGGSFTTFNIIVNDYNTLATSYTNLIRALKSMTSEANSFFSLRNNLRNFYANSNLTELKEHPEGKEFELLYNDLKAFSDSFSNQGLQFYTYKKIKKDILDALKKRMETYAVVSLKEGENNSLNSYWDAYFKNRISSAEKSKTFKQSEYEYYNNKTTSGETDNIIQIRPIVMTYNRYEMSAINGWDGNKLYTGSNEEGDYLFAPQMGAGKKENDNSFTGMIMGVRKKSEENRFDIGLFGYKKGIETMFLNAQTGAASFGMSGAGQIIIQPGDESNKEAVIYGGNYVEGESGLIIDLTTPEIKFGSGNFVVNAKGFLTAKGGGDIAGWEISDTTLSKQTEEGKITLDSSLMSIYSHNHNTIGSTNEGFYLGPEGMSLGSSIRIFDSEIYVGNVNGRRWVITAKNNQSYIAYNTEGIAQEGYLRNNSVYIGTDGISLGKYFKVDKTGMLQVGHLNGKHWKMYAGSDGESFIYYGSNSAAPSLNAERKSVYLGTDGISLGYYFKATNDGTVKVGNVKGTKHWTITSKGDEGEAYIAYNTTSFNTDSNSVYIGTDGISLGNNDSFHVTNSGFLKATSGTISGWELSSNTLSGGNIIINSEGSLSGGETYNWSITKDGIATFAYLVASTGGNIAGWKISSDGLTGGNMYIKSEGSIGGSDWSIDENGIANFSNTASFSDVNVTGGKMAWPDGFEVKDTGEINAPSGNIGPWVINDDGISDSKDKSNRQVFITPTGDIKIGKTTTYMQIDDTNINIIAGNIARIQGSVSTYVSGPVYLGGTDEITGMVIVTNGDLKAKTITTGTITLGTTLLDEAKLKNLLGSLEDSSSE